MERFCTQCGKELRKDGKFCPYCGHELLKCTGIEEMDLERALSGDELAMERIYKLTYPQGYAVALQMMRNQEDAMDVMQEAYITAFGKLEQLKDYRKLKSWFNCIVANKCRDFLRKKHPALFTDLQLEEELSIEEQLVEERIEFSPDESMDYREVKRLMNDILLSLPGDQRLVVLMYYYEELGLGEIAGALECSKGTVKSRLNYARKKIRAEVEKLEKQGTKLYGVTPLPFLVWMLREAEQSVRIPEFSKAAVLLQSGMAGAHAGLSGAGAGSGTVGAGTAAASVSVSVGTKVIIGVVAAAVIGGGAAGVKYYQEQKEAKPQEQVQQEVEAEEDETDVSEEKLSNFQTILEEYDYIGNQTMKATLNSEGESYNIEEYPGKGYYGYFMEDLDSDGEEEMLLVTTSEFARCIQLSVYEYQEKEWILYQYVDFYTNSSIEETFDIAWNPQKSQLIIYDSVTNVSGALSKQVSLYDMKYSESGFAPVEATYILNGVDVNPDTKNAAYFEAVNEDAYEKAKLVEDMDLNLPPSDQSSSLVRIVRFTNRLTASQIMLDEWFMGRHNLNSEMVEVTTEDFTEETR